MTANKESGRGGECVVSLNLRLIVAGLDILCDKGQS